MNLFRWIKQFITPSSEDPIAAFERSLAEARAALLENLDPVPEKSREEMYEQARRIGQPVPAEVLTTMVMGEPSPAVPPWPSFRTCLDCGCPWVWHNNEGNPRRCCGHGCECQTMRSQAERFAADEVTP